MSKAQFLADNLNPGEVYAGLVLAEKEGDRDYHLFVLPGEAEDINWKDAIAWAKSIGGELPNRREQRVLFANAKAAFKPEYYWSNTQHASASNHAWDQTFGNGGQGYDGKSAEVRARAVRRLFI